MAKVMILELQENWLPSRVLHPAISLICSMKCQLQCCKLPYEGPYGKEL